MNGHYANGKQRFFCKNCHCSFSKKNKTVKLVNEFAWFRKWLLNGYTVKQLSEMSRKSEKKIHLIINHWLSRRPLFIPGDLSKMEYSVFDGSFIWKRKLGTIIMLDAEKGKLIKGEFDVKENSPTDLRRFFSELKQSGLSLKSATIDGNPTVVGIMEEIWPEIIIQRCLVHIQRQGLMWCRMNPKTTEAKKLREIFLELTKVWTKEQKQLFLKTVADWENDYGKKIASKKETGWVFSDLKRARSMLLKALPNTFHYLDNPNIPRTSNLAEGYFSFMKSRYRDHRGLSPKKRANFFNWFFILKP